MESLIKASEQNQAVAKEEKINTDLFNEFMKKLLCGITLVFQESII